MGSPIYSGFVFIIKKSNYLYFLALRFACSRGKLKLLIVGHCEYLIIDYNSVLLLTATALGDILIN